MRMFFLKLAVSFLSAVQIVTAVDAFAEDIMFTGTWTPEVDNTVPCPHSYTNNQDARASLTFRGNHLDLYIPRAGNGGVITIQIDNSTVERDSKAEIYDCDTPLYSTDLPQGEHTVTIGLKRGTVGYINVHKFVYTTPQEVTTISSLSTLSVASTASGFAGISSQSTWSLQSVASTNSVISVRISGGVKTASSSPDAVGTAGAGATGSTSLGHPLVLDFPKEGFAAVVITLLGTFVAMLI